MSTPTEFTELTGSTGSTVEPYPGLPLTVRDVGAGRPVLVLHGGAGPASVSGVVDHFAATSRVLAPTHPGWEDTPRPEWFTGVDDLVETYLDLLDDRDLRDVLVLGSSFGGWIAAEMAVRDRGRRIGGLVVMGAFGPRLEGHEVRFPTAPPGPPPGEGSGPAQGPRPGAGSGAPAPRPGPSPAALQALAAYVGPAKSDPKLLHRLARVTVPALAVWGEDDTVVPPDYGRAYAAAIPGARFELIPGAGHLPTREAPEVTFAAIDAFLDAAGR
ncbi:alpha/beta fold hydrolase [Streptomyces iranensis]|uniref:Alpha/beta hydrolase fold containing protein n=1 Tax=Streptomyces iranensis TaxID=576784 RepID=A0A060ZHU4_9ACTN|nr:alpha/beta hydrolase [Streptomyces iranensis]MBP2061127.1 pimeloyl-ACP methyl ester carboxylesterase [Streptomyces iranensis]CDR05605.1 alpha/beta hydrolase fold containing protein [Streptomyces iranensis]